MLVIFRPPISYQRTHSEICRRIGTRFSSLVITSQCAYIYTLVRKPGPPLNTACHPRCYCRCCRPALAILPAPLGHSVPALVRPSQPFLSLPPEDPS